MRKIVVWFAMAMAIAGFAAAAEKPKLKLSEVRPAVERLVEEASHGVEKLGLRKLSRGDKAEMVESIIARMKEQGTYDFVE
jgi:hypothetical protein